MGVQGLRKFVDSVAPQCSLDATRNPSTEHLAFDLNCVVYQCFSKNHRSAGETIAVVIDFLRRFVEEIRPSKTVIFALDGPAPLAKLQTQRLRRRKVQHVDTTNNTGYSDLEITAGSELMQLLTDKLVEFAKEVQQRFKLAMAVVAGGLTVGEGEAKIAQSLLAVADSSVYAPVDRVVLVGNDIDLVLTLCGLTPFFNSYLLSPSSKLYFDMPSLFSKWVGDQGIVGLADLASLRLDFVFIMSLAGGDHFIGISDSAMEVWRRYRTLRQRRPETALIEPSSGSLNCVALREVLASQSYRGDADSAVGQKLLLAALWSMKTTCSGRCPDYRFTAPELEVGPHLGHIHAAILAQDKIAVPVTKDGPLCPLATFVALMPSASNQPKPVREFLGKRKDLASALSVTYADPGRLSQAVNRVVREIDPKAWSPMEKKRLQFQPATTVDHNGRTSNFTPPRSIVQASIPSPVARSLYDAALSPSEDDATTSCEPAPKKQRKETNSKAILTNISLSMDV